MADQWYFASDAQKLGPYSALQLQELAVLDKLRPGDLVWKNDMEKGVLAARVRHLFPVPSATTVAAVEMPASPVQAPAVLAAILSGEGALPEGPPLPSSVDGNAAGRLVEIPTVVLLQAIPGLSDLKPLPTPWTNAPGTGTDLNATPVTLPALTGIAALPEAKPAAVPQPYQQARSSAVRKRRATVVRGAVIVFQDGDNVKFRKKCIKCSHEDTSARSVPIKTGITRLNFYCPKCRKSGDVVIQGNTV